MKIYLLIFSFLMRAYPQADAQINYKAEEIAVRKVLQLQQDAWNEANIEAFMKGYWKSDSITFIGSEITQGWDATLARYKKSYPDQAAMGKLRFEILRVNFISKDACMITGKYFLTRANDAPNGIFTLLFRKKEGQWVIVYDHTS
jgi:hypothetical protein